MIDKSYIESAKTIRKEFLELNEKLSEYQNYVKDLADSFIKIAGDIETWKDNDIMKEKSVKSAGDFMLGKLDEIEQETEKLNKRVEPINKKLEKLREEENKLYKLIKERYPTLSDDQIIRQINQNI
jgi:predicted  nucleic acid-binding Zn-ribbon protein